MMGTVLSGRASWALWLGLLLLTLSAATPARAEAPRYDLPRGIGYSTGVILGMGTGLVGGVAGFIAVTREPDCSDVIDFCGSGLAAMMLGAPVGLLLGGIDGAILAHAGYRVRRSAPWLAGAGVAVFGGTLVALAARGDHTAWTNGPKGLALGRLGVLCLFLGSPITAELVAADQGWRSSRTAKLQLHLAPVLRPSEPGISLAGRW